MQRPPRLRVQEKNCVRVGDPQGTALHRRMSRKMAVLRTQGSNHARTQSPSQSCHNISMALHIGAGKKAVRTAFL